MPPRPLPPKKEVALALLEATDVLVHLDPRKPEVIVPAWFKKQPQLTLEVGLNMPVPIRDLVVDDDGISCTLSFNRTPFWCRLPWSAVFALVGRDERAMVWPDDVPPEVAAAMGRPQPALAPAAAPAPAPAKRRAVRGRKRDGAAEQLTADEPASVPGEGPSRTLAHGEPDAAALLPDPPPPPQPPRTPTRPAGLGGAKPKRELPPYLRVVK